MCFPPVFNFEIPQGITTRARTKCFFSIVENTNSSGAAKWRKRATLRIWLFKPHALAYFFADKSVLMGGRPKQDRVLGRGVEAVCESAANVANKSILKHANTNIHMEHAQPEVGNEMSLSGTWKWCWSDASHRQTTTPPQLPCFWESGQASGQENYVRHEHHRSKATKKKCKGHLDDTET